MWLGAFAALLVLRCCQNFSSLLSGNSGLLTKIVQAESLPFPYKTLWWICVSACGGYGGSWRVQILGHTLKNWLLIMHGWPCLSICKPSNVRGPPHLLPRYLRLELSRHVHRNIACFRLRAHTLELKPVVGKSTIGSVTIVTCMMSR